ncbi:MAG: DUF1232 domain-containing protein [Candidatus Eremiobacteraeota bacterium]|nr:DUF1232 domain-containing protein [Candidatus Eremiobacteraeota bacterium]
MKFLSLLFSARKKLFTVVPLLRDARVPGALKIITVALGLLVISPLDIFSDIPVLGAVDDAALLTLLCLWFVGRANKHILRNVTPVAVRSSALAL